MGFSAVSCSESNGSAPQGTTAAAATTATTAAAAGGPGTAPAEADSVGQLALASTAVVAAAASLF